LIRAPSPHTRESSKVSRDLLHADLGHPPEKLGSVGGRVAMRDIKRYGRVDANPICGRLS